MEDNNKEIDEKNKNKYQNQWLKKQNDKLKKDLKTKQEEYNLLKKGIVNLRLTDDLRKLIISKVDEPDLVFFEKELKKGVGRILRYRKDSDNKENYTSLEIEIDEMRKSLEKNKS